MQRLDRKWRLLYQSDLVNESGEDYDPLPFEIDEENIEKDETISRFIFFHCLKIVRKFL